MKLKFAAIFLPFILSGCFYYTHPKYNVEQIHSLPTYTEPVSADTLSIFNSIGTINITPSTDENLSIDCQIIYNGPNTDDFKAKTKDVILTPYVENDVILLEALVNNTNYWRWLDINIDDDRLEMVYDIKIPSYIENLRIINEIGKINIENTTTSLDLQQITGIINCSNVSIMDFSDIFLDNGQLTFSCDNFLEVDNISHFVNTGSIKFSSNNLSNLNYLFNKVNVGTLSCQLPAEKSSYLIANSFIPDLDFSLEKNPFISEDVIQTYRAQLLADKNYTEYKNMSLDSDSDQPLPTIVANSIDVGVVSIE
ncbi:MAG: hypothetical protein ATN31_05845 [Candidatus Epulonipiscioides saccharophilum]|nr:MAG: hypothetical protein ATN31_05845 [Epulopiscium sp. AS2M-Bin001]